MQTEGASLPLGYSLRGRPLRDSLSLEKSTLRIKSYWHCSGNRVHYLLDDRCENFFRDKTGVLIDFICNVNEISQRPEIHHFQDYVDLSLLIVSAEAFDQVLALVTCQQHLKVVQHLVPLGFFVDADFLEICVAEKKKSVSEFQFGVYCTKSALLLAYGNTRASWPSRNLARKIAPR